jgi:hypothetical protein
MNRLNNLFPTDENIDMVKEYLRTKVLPPEIKSGYHLISDRNTSTLS